MIIASRVVSTVVRHSAVMVESCSREMLRGLGVVRLRRLALLAAFAARRFVVLGMLVPRNRVNGEVVYYSRSATDVRELDVTAPLEDLLVVEGSAFVAAPLAGMTLGQLGADVIRFDPIEGGLDVARWPVDAAGKSLYWVGLNKGKRSLRVDIRSERGRELVYALLALSGTGRGLFLTNFPAQGWLDYETIRASTRDDLVMVNVLGSTDGRSALDYSINCAVGYPLVTGDASRESPVNHVFPAWDAMTGVSAALAMMAAERQRRMTGQGQLARVSLADVALWMVGNLGHIAEVEVAQAERPALGNDLFGAFGRDFPTADGERIYVVAITKQQWRGLVEATGIAAAVAEIERREGVDLQQEGQRFGQRDAIAVLIAPWIASRPLTEVATAFDAQKVCWGRYQTFRQLVEEDPRCSEVNPMFKRLEQPGIGSYLMPGLPIGFSASPRQIRRAPILGEHTDEILSVLLALSDQEIGRLHDAKVVAGPLA
jgi:2-methylfumaryl-CoA isomerase